MPAHSLVLKMAPLRFVDRAADPQSLARQAPATIPPEPQNKIYAANCSARLECRQAPGRKLRPTACPSRKSLAQTLGVPAGTLPKSWTAPPARTLLRRRLPAREKPAGT